MAERLIATNKLRYLKRLVAGTDEKGRQKTHRKLILQQWFANPFAEGGGLSEGDGSWVDVPVKGDWTEPAEEKTA